MVIVLKQNTPAEEINRIKGILEKLDLMVNPIVGTTQTILGLVGDTTAVDQDAIQTLDCVEKIVKISESYKRANRKMHPSDTVITLKNGTTIGGNKIAVMAGPCSVETKEQITAIAQYVKGEGAAILRGGAFKPRSSPYAFQGLKAEGLELLALAQEQTNMPIVSEITTPSQIEMFIDKVDIFQVGARNMQNFELLKELGQINKPVLLKRGFSNTIEEFLMSAEYICAGGNSEVILCERGIRTFETFTRNTLDISAIPVLKKLSHLPVVVDPSHATGLSWLVEPLAVASIAAGADGLIIEVHNNPKEALCDGAQSLTFDMFSSLMNKIKPIAAAIGREI